MPKVLVYKRDNHYSRIDKELSLCGSFVFNTKEELYFITDEELTFKDDKLVKVGNSIAHHYLDMLMMFSHYSLKFRHDVGIIEDLQDMDDKKNDVHFEYEGEKLIRIGDYEVIYDNDEIVDFILKPKEKSELEKFIEEHQEQLDKYHRIAEAVEEEMEEIYEYKRNHPEMYDTDYQVEVTNRFIEENPDVEHVEIDVNDDDKNEDN